MTISSTITKQSFECNGSLREFDFGFTANSADDIKALIRDANSVETKLTVTAQYSVMLNADGSGGTLTTVATWATGNTLIVYRETPHTQETAYKNNNALDQEVLADDLDKMIMIAQETDEKVNRALIFPMSDPVGSVEMPSVASRVNRVLAFDADGELTTALSLVLAVEGPAFAVDSSVAEFHGATGKLLKDGSLAHIDVASAISLKHSNSLDHNEATVSAPLSITGQAIKLVNDAGATVTEIDTGVVGDSDTVIPTSKAVKTAIAASSGLADGGVTQAKLKTSIGSVSVYGETKNLTLPGGGYGFYPQVKATSADAQIITQIANLPSGIGTTPTSYRTNVYLSANTGYTIYAQQRYVTSSGEVHWVFILRDKTTKNTLAMYQAPDHPCFGNGGKPLLVPHPFVDYDPKKHEIIVINPSDEDIFNMQDACIMPEDKPDKDILEVIIEDYEIDEDLQTEWPKKEITVGLPKNIDWKRMPDGSKVVPVKKRIPQLSYITTRKLWKRK